MVSCVNGQKYFLEGTKLEREGIEEDCWVMSWKGSGFQGVTKLVKVKYGQMEFWSIRGTAEKSSILNENAFRRK